MGRFRNLATEETDAGIDMSPLLRRAQELKPRDDIQKYLDQIERIAKTK